MLLYKWEEFTFALPWLLMTTCPATPVIYSKKVSYL